MNDSRHYEGYEEALKKASTMNTDQLKKLIADMYGYSQLPENPSDSDIREEFLRQMDYTWLTPEEKDRAQNSPYAPAHQKSFQEKVRQFLVSNKSIDQFLEDGMAGGAPAVQTSASISVSPENSKGGPIEIGNVNKGKKKKQKKQASSTY
jgi:hypothetical protein